MGCDERDREESLYLSIIGILIIEMCFKNDISIEIIWEGILMVVFIIFSNLFIFAGERDFYFLFFILYTFEDDFLIFLWERENSK